MSRLEQFARNTDLERLILELNSLLGPIEEELIRAPRSPRWPIILIVGSPRSGTTLVMQWLASLGVFAYPTNLLSRFYAAPYIGSRIQQLLVDPRFRFRDEFAELAEAKIDFSSSLGKTRGVLAPNEFWYFWRRFFDFGGIDYLNDEKLAEVDSERFVSELALIETAFEKPVCMKAMIMNSNLAYLDRVLERVVFMHVIRRPFYNMQSLLEARTRYSGDLRKWYSFRPREYEQLRHRSPYEQVAGQVYFLNTAIQSALRQVALERSLSVGYEELCAAPAEVYESLRERCAAQGLEIPSKYAGPEIFDRQDVVRVSEIERVQLVSAYAGFSGEEVCP